MNDYRPPWLTGDEIQRTPFDSRERTATGLTFPEVPAGGEVRIVEFTGREPSVISIWMDRQSTLGVPGSFYVQVSTFVQGGKRVRQFATGWWGVSINVPAGLTTVEVAHELTDGAVVLVSGEGAPGRATIEHQSELIRLEIGENRTVRVPWFARLFTATLMEGDAFVATTVDHPTFSLAVNQPLTLPAGEWQIGTGNGGSVVVTWEVFA